MFTQLVEIEPQELKFIFELKKQSSCSVRLLNKTNEYVAFKVKTTRPKKYSVRPNAGVIEPKSTCDFIVIMQAQRVAPPEMICKDKFLVQNVVVPLGTTEDMISSSLFIKDDGKYVEDNKLRVILASPPHSPVLSRKNGEHNDAITFPPHSPVLSPMNGVHNEAPAFDATLLHNQILHRVDTVRSQHKVTEILVSKVEDDSQLTATKDLDLEKLGNVKEQELVKDVVNMKSQISELEHKLKEAYITIPKLMEEKRLTIQKRDTLQKELALWRRKKGMRGFPFLFVCMTSLISAFLGYLLHC